MGQMRCKYAESLLSRVLPNLLICAFVPWRENFYFWQPYLYLDWYVNRQNWLCVKYNYFSTQCHMQMGVVESFRIVKYLVQFPDAICPQQGANLPPSLARIETGGTALDVMIAAADRKSALNFKSTYFGNNGYFITQIGDTANNASIGTGCFWSFYYKIPGLAETRSSLGVSNVVIPGDGWSVIMRYEQFQHSAKSSAWVARYKNTWIWTFIRLKVWHWMYWQDLYNHM